MKIDDFLQKHILVFDGAMGTYYSGGKAGKERISEYANITEPEIIGQIHKEYLKAGANLIRTNTFAANQLLLAERLDKQEEIIRSGCRIAKQSVESADVSQECFIAADIGPVPELGQEDTDTFQEYKKILDIFLEEGMQIFLFETFSDLEIIKKAAVYLKQKDAFIIANFCINQKGYTASGIRAARLLQEISEIKEIDAAGFNCGIGSGHMYGVLENLNLPKEKYFFVLPNAGYPEQMQNRLVFMNNCSYFVKNMEKIIALGVDGIGGCCGTTPEYIKQLNQLSAQKKTKKKEILVIERNSGISKKQEINTFQQALYSGEKVIAVELDPPYGADDEKLIKCSHDLKKHGVNLITIADSPMGKSRADSILMSVKIKRETGQMVMPHICCRDKNRIAMRSMLLGAYANDIQNLLIITGDPVPPEQRGSATAVFDYNSIRLMNFVKEMNQEEFKESPFLYGGALNYGLGNPDIIIERMKKKIEAGAAFFLTQPVYSDEDIERIHYIKQHTDTKILCGIMPLVSYRNARFMKNEIAGIQVPDNIMEQYQETMSKEEGEITGARIAQEIIQKVEGFVDGFYFMLPFNRTSLLDKINVKR